MDAQMMSAALGICKLGRFEKEAHEEWMYGCMYGQENESIALDSFVRTWKLLLL